MSNNRRHTKTMSIFGQIEAAVAESMVSEGIATKIPLEHFPSRTTCPEVWTNEHGQEAKFAVAMRVDKVVEFNTRVAALRA